jgi:predicted DNA-binding protein
MTERKNISLTLSVSPETRNKLRELSFIQDKTHSAIVIELIDAEYRKVKAQKVLDNANQS